MSNSFITNVNTLVDNLSAVYTANEKLTPEVINQLTALNLVQLQAVYVELAKIVDVQANMSSVVTTAGAIESIVTLANYLDAASAPSIVEDLILINSKLDALTASVDFLTETITGLGSAQLAIESQSSPVFADIPTVPTIMPFNVETPSSNTDIISTDALQDTITFKLNGSYTFTSNVSVTSKTNTTVALSFKIVDIATGNVLATESNTVHISKHSTATLPLTTLLTISNAPVTVRVEAQSTASGYELTAFNSLLVSSVTVGLPDIYAERLYVVEKDSSTGAAKLPSGNTAERPDTAELGAIRYNTDINEYEGYTDSGWESLAAGATGSNGDNVFLIIDKVMTNDYTVPENKRAVAFGDVELIGDLTIPNNSELLVLGDYKDGMVVVNDISKLSTVNTSVSTNVAVKSYHNGLEGGGGVFYYDSTKPRTEHNGGTVIAPTAVFPSDWNNQVQLAAWFDGSSLTGNGCWVRSYDGAVNVRWFGAKGDGVSDDRYCFQASINKIPSGSVLRIPKGVYKLVYLSGSSIVTLTKNIHIVGDGARQTIIVGYGDSPTSAVLEIAMEGSDNRHWLCKGLNLYHGTGSNLKDGLLITKGLNQTSLITECSFGGSSANDGCSIRSTESLVHSEISLCTLGTRAVLKLGDANVIRKNLTFGVGAAFEIDMEAGVRNNIIKDNTLVNRDGWLIVNNADTLRFENNQCELGQFYTPSTNQNTYSAGVWVKGTEREVRNFVISGNNFGGGTNYRNSIYLENCTDAVIEKNNFIAAGYSGNSPYAELVITDTCKNTIVYGDNSCAGTQLSPREDSFHPLIVTDSGVNTKNVVQTISGENGWSDFKLIKNSTGFVSFVTHPIGGATTVGTVVANFTLDKSPVFLDAEPIVNLLSNSEYFNRSTWYKGLIALTPSDKQTPELLANGTRVSAGSDTGIHSLRSPSVNIQANSRYCISMYLAKTSVSSVGQVTFDFQESSFVKWARFYVDLDTLTVTANANGNYYTLVDNVITTDVNGWCRVKVTFDTKAADFSGNFFVAVTPNNVASTTTSYTAIQDVNVVDVWGVQVEQSGCSLYQKVDTVSSVRYTVEREKLLPCVTSLGAGMLKLNRQGKLSVDALPSSTILSISEYVSHNDITKTG